MPAHPETSLARLLCARLCHDLGGAIGSMTGALDLARPGEDELLALAQETGAALRQRLRLYAAAWGGAGAELPAEELAGLLAATPAAPRVRFDLTGLAPGGRLPAALVPLALNAALLAAESVTRRGIVHLSGTAETGLTVLPVADSGASPAAWPGHFLALLAGDASAELGPRQVVAPLLLALLEEAGWRASLGHGAGPGAAPLLLTPA
ncbi:hypothetical protein JMJ55_05595 [Belnapia sp. T6]|uniref:Histidine phosphotransferase ChpT C-terminal domain-containing protein n=1 Tax=Belnapia mucosa TaxID=2804532 RepID=A0ABS1UZA1_9PROT|nr:histidine phosphotransferase family protein [Belnapia mucosa]MBL6454788.1 hypothetical protein [Belnapia mucosa]